MKNIFIFSAIAFVGTQAQAPPATTPAPKGPPKSGAGGNAGVMSALGQLYGEKGVPYGPAPKGCSLYEVIFGMLLDFLLCVNCLHALQHVERLSQAHSDSSSAIH
jgi:hypothetical protein